MEDVQYILCLFYPINNLAYVFGPLHDLEEGSVYSSMCGDVAGNASLLFIFSNYPKRCRGSSITLVCGQQHFSTLKAECSKFSNITVEAAVIPFPYGTHHSKLSIFESDDAIHVMISTANLIPDDYGLKTQCFYYCRYFLNFS